MKFQLVIEASEKRLILIPEDQAEAVLLGTICDPNTTRSGLHSADDGPNTVTATVTVKSTDDRPPYRKVKELHITL